MSVLKCKMCGGELNISDKQLVCECEYCGSKQTLPRLDNDKKINLYDRANHLRRNNDFDKAENIYEQILNEDNTDAEAYWSLVLCKYGIEYVEDPLTKKRVPTINRTQFESILADLNYKEAIKYADPEQKTIYENEAKEIDKIQKNILEISKKEKPFDVFICYKENDEKGRTVDSVIANDLYHELVKQGYKVFFARITLEDKLGEAYEPYIFAALNTAKIMIVLGTRPDYFNAVWVKNEWSRYLQLIKKGEKKALIPAYRDMDPYDLPEDFSHLQALDMSKIGFMQDLLRGINKIIGDTNKENELSNNTPTNSKNQYDSLLKRAAIFLEDGDFDMADKYYDKVLDIDPENSNAYLGKLLVREKLKFEENLIQHYLMPKQTISKSLKIAKFDDILNPIIQKYEVPGYFDESEIKNILLNDEFYYYSSVPSAEQNKDEVERIFDNDKLISKIIRYSDKSTTFVDKVIDELNEKIDEITKEEEAFVSELKEKFILRVNLKKESISKQSDQAAKEREEDYSEFVKIIDTSDSIDKLRYTTVLSTKLGDYKDTTAYREKRSKKIEELKEKQKLLDKQHKEKTNKLIKIILAIIAIVVLLSYLYINVLKPKIGLMTVKRYYESQQYEKVITLLSKDNLGAEGTKILNDSRYKLAEKRFNEGNYAEAIILYSQLPSNEKNLITKAKYYLANQSLEKGDYINATNIFKELDDFEDSKEKAKISTLALVEELIEKEKYENILLYLDEIEKDDEVNAKIKEVSAFLDENAYQIPDYTNVFYKDVTADLDKKGIKYETKHIRNNSLKDDYVLYTTPKANTYMNKNQKLEVYICKNQNLENYEGNSNTEALFKIEITKSGNKLRVRGTPSTKYEKIRNVSTGQKYDVYEVVLNENYKWYRIKANLSEWIADDGTYTKTIETYVDNVIDLPTYDYTYRKYTGTYKYTNENDGTAYTLKLLDNKDFEYYDNVGGIETEESGTFDVEKDQVILHYKKRVRNNISTQIDIIEYLLIEEGQIVDHHPLDSELDFIVLKKIS